MSTASARKKPKKRNPRLTQRAELLRQAERLPGVADVVAVTIAALKAQSDVSHFFWAPEANGSYASHTN